MNSNPKKRMSRILSAKIFGFSVFLHVIFFSFVSFVLWVCTPSPETVIPIDMTIVPPWAEKTDDPDPDPNPPEEEEEVEEKEEKVEEVKEEKRDVIIREKPKPKPKPFVKGKLKKTPPKKFNRSKKLIKAPRMPVGKGTAAEKPMSAADIQKYLNQGYKFGSRNQIAANEMQRCVSVIGAAIRREWDKESFNWYPGLKPIQVTLKFGQGGSIVRWQLVSGSGDNDVDRTARNALSRLRRISGLSVEFLSKYSEITVEMKPVQ